MKPYKEQTYYELLEVGTDATMDEIRAAYDRAVRLYDSDNVALYPLGDPAQVEDLKKLLLEAMEILTDADLRVEYDRSLGLAVKERHPPSEEPVAVSPVSGGVPIPAEVAQVDARAAEARQQADQKIQAEARAEADREKREERAREEDDDAQIDQRRLPKLDPIPPEDPPEAAEADVQEAPVSEQDDEPAQLVMMDVVSRAETVHSTAPRYSVSYIPHAPPPPRPPESSEPPATEAIQTAAPHAERTELARPAPEVPPEPPTPLVARPPAAQLPPPLEPEPRPAAEPPAPPSSRAASLYQPPPLPEEFTPPPEPPLRMPKLEPSMMPPGAPVPPPRHTPAAPMPVPPPLPRSTPIMGIPVPAQGLAQGDAQMGASGEPGRAPSRALDQAPVMSQESAIAAAESAMAQVSAHLASRPRDGRARAPEIAADAVFNGELFRQIRQSRGQTLQQLADKTRISARHLENIEADRYNALPTTVYLRGFLMSLARELGVDPIRASKGYLALVEQHGGTKAK